MQAMKSTRRTNNNNKKNNNKMLLLLVVVVEAVLGLACWNSIPTASSFSFGAGGCFASRSSVASIHLRQMKIVTGSLENGQLMVLLNDQPLSTTKINRFTIHQVHTLTLTTFKTDGYFRGFLFRLGDAHAVTDKDALSVPGDAATSINDTSHHVQPTFLIPAPEGPTSSSIISSASNTISTSSIDINSIRNKTNVNTPNVQLAASCLLHNASGIGHTNHDKKTTVSGILYVDRVIHSGLRLDVTVVIHNRNHISEFYYSGYDMRAVPSNTITGYWGGTLAIVVIGILTVGVIGTAVVRWIKKRRFGKNNKKSYFELTSVKMAEDGSNGDAIIESPHFGRAGGNGNADDLEDVDAILDELDREIT